MKRSPMPPRVVPLARTTTLAPGAPLTRRTELGRSSHLKVVTPDGAPVREIRTARSHPAAFTPRVRGLIHVRSGGLCEACGIPLPDGKGQLQHRIARGMGGSRNPLLGSPANGADLCGTPSSGCHGLCEARDPRMHEMGWWLNSWENLLEVPVTLHTGARRWLTGDGIYSRKPPQDGAA